MFRAQADWTFILPSEFPAKELRHLPRKVSLRGTTYSEMGWTCTMNTVYIGRENAAARHHVMRSLISLHNEHRVHFTNQLTDFCRSQWPRGPNHELFSLAWTLGSWVRIPLKAWMSVFAFILCMCCAVYVAALRRADPPSKESYRLRKKVYETEE
jgi:hypothetical protein